MQASNFDEKVKYFSTIQEPIVKEKPSVMNLVSRFEQQAQPKPDDHAIVDEVDVRKLSVILGHEPEHRDIADIQDNKTDDDQPDLERDESSGEKLVTPDYELNVKHDPSMENFTEATDITTPVEMGQESVLSRREDFDTSYQISDIPLEAMSRQEKQLTSPATLHKETLFEITDLEDLTDTENDNRDEMPEMPLTSRSDRTLVAESPDCLDDKIRRREKTIDRKFDRLSMDLSDAEVNLEKEIQMDASQLSREEEEQAAQSFDKIIFENFAEDQSEDWLTHGSETTPDREVEQDIFGEPDNDFKGKAKGRSIGILITQSQIFFNIFVVFKHCLMIFLQILFS